MSAHYQIHSWRSSATSTQEARRVALLHRHSQQTPLACSRHSPNGDERRRGNLVIARRAPRSLTHLNHWCVMARETDLLPAWRQSDGVIGQLGLTTFTVHSPSSSVVVPSTRYVLTDDEAHTLARATTPASLSRRARGTRWSDPREKKRKESCVRLFTDMYPRLDELSTSATVLSHSCETRCSVSADQFRACDKRARNRWIDQPFTADNATFLRDIPRKSTVATGIE